MATGLAARVAAPVVADAGEAQSPESWTDAERLTYFAPLLLASDEIEFRKRDAVARILTPTSKADLHWMLAHQYPRREDVENPDVDALLSTIRANGLRDHLAVDYARNVLAAYYYRQGDERWREMLSAGDRAFFAMLQVEDARNRFARREIEAGDVAAILIFAQTWGEADAFQLFRGMDHVTFADVDILSTANSTAIALRTVDQYDAYLAMQGLAPRVRTPRPRPAWMEWP